MNEGCICYQISNVQISHYVSSLSTNAVVKTLRKRYWKTDTPSYSIIRLYVTAVCPISLRVKD